MRRVLMVHYYFPPLGGIGSLRAARLASCLADFGWEATVVAPRAGSYHRDPTLSTGGTRVVRTRSVELSRLGKRLVLGDANDVKPARVGPFTGYIRGRVRSWIYRPDAQIGWYPFGLAAGRRLLKERRFDVVYSSSFPITAHLIGRRLAREAGIPWVAEFRDPWADVKSDEDGSRDEADRLERSLLSSAAAVVTVSPTLEALWRSKGARRTMVVTNGFDPNGHTGGPASGMFVVTHVGSYYPHMQDLGCLWDALALSKSREPDLRLQIRVLGDSAGELGKEVEARGLGAELVTTGFVHHSVALESMARSSVLVVAGTARRHRIYDCLLPAKLFEYLGTSRPILYVGETETDAGRLLATQPGCWMVEAGDAPAAATALREIRGAPSHFERHLDALTRRALAGRLSVLLGEIAGASGQ